MVWRRELCVLLNWTDILDGEIVNAAWAVAGMVAKPRASRRAAADLDTATWADTERLIKDALAEITASRKIPDLSEVVLSEAGAAELTAALNRHEVQGALQALLAARLTDAPETDAGRAREVLAARLAARDAVRLAVGGAVTSPTEPAGTGAARPERRRSSPAGDTSSGEAAEAGTGPVTARYAEQLSEYLDDRVSALVATLEGRVGFEGLAQVRAEAYNSRIVALLGTLADMVAALSHPDRGGPEEAEFLRRYRRQLRERHGKLEPPDFERRRKVPVEKIYVNTPVCEYSDQKADSVMETAVAKAGGTPDLNVMDLAGLIDRTVLLGDPGGGKTTAANVLTNSFAGDTGGKVPFLVTLRDYAAKDPPERSVAGHIEHALDTLYQCPAPAGLVERLLLTERAIVFFDGLDELLDTSRRREVSDMVEQFCSAYPLTPVLVTSRLVGYDQARLDDDQFTCYRLSNFSDNQVAEYAHKWFAVQEGSVGAEADAEANAFLAESGNVHDLQSNPLLLSLMCILYRGEGFLPRNRAEVYEQCANLLFRKWDARRRIHKELRADHLVEPAIRYLAWWLLTSGDPQTAVTEQQLIAETTGFMHGRGFESEDQARSAAREFVEFCRGRMWVLRDAGTTAAGQKLYAFTHRTFLEYFAATHLAAISDSPEDLAGALAPRLQTAGWEVIGELAVQIKNRSSDRGADRIYAVLLDPAAGALTGKPLELASKVRESLLSFVIRCLESAEPSPASVRKLACAAIDYLVDSGVAENHGRPLEELLRHSARHRDVVADEISTRIADMVASDDTGRRRDGLCLGLWIRWNTAHNSFWYGWCGDQLRNYQNEMTSIADSDSGFRVWAVMNDVLPMDSALKMPGGLSSFIRPQSVWGMYEINSGFTILSRDLSFASDGRGIRAFAAIGRHLVRHKELPWAITPPLDTYPAQGMFRSTDFLQQNSVDEVTYLGIVSSTFIAIESSAKSSPSIEHRKNGPITLLRRYADHRMNRDQHELPELPVPAEFRQLFLDWAEGRVNFVEIPAEDPDG